MSILQVNVRPAVGIRTSVNSQRGGEPGRTSMTQTSELSTNQSAANHPPFQQNHRQPRAASVATRLNDAKLRDLSFTTFSAAQASPTDRPHAMTTSATKFSQLLVPTEEVRLQQDPTEVERPITDQQRRRLQTQFAGKPTVALPNGALAKEVVTNEVMSGEVVSNEVVSSEIVSREVVSTPVWQSVVWKLMPATTVGRALNSARERLNEVDCPTASLDAQVILAYVLGVDRSWLFAHHEYKLNATQADQYTDLIARRMQHEPVAYLVGRKEFYGLEFYVDQRVLIPRPETELLVDVVLDFAGMVSEEERVKIADVGTGSGAIALSVANHCDNADIYAIDLSLDALEVAERNITRLDARGQVTLAQGDLLTPLPEQVHVIVANLPYISNELYSTLDADVRDFEPQLALEAGPEGLDAIHRLLRQAHRYLRPNGAIFLEIGYDQGSAVRTLAQTIFPNAQRLTVRQDYHGRDRLVTIMP